jgi:hypothetical protein
MTQMQKRFGAVCWLMLLFAASASAQIDSAQIDSLHREFLRKRCDLSGDARNQFTTADLDALIKKEITGSSEGAKAIYQLEVDVIRHYPTKDPLEPFRLCVLTKHINSIDRTTARMDSLARAAQAPAPTAAVAKSTSPAQGGTGPQAHGWVCNPTGIACMIRVSELRGYNKFTHDCPAMVPYTRDNTGQLVATLSWENNRQVLRNIVESAFKGITPAQKADYARAKALYECDKANGGQPDPGTYSFIDSAYTQSVEGTTALFQRIVTGDREFKDISGGNVIYMDHGFMPASRYDKFMTASTVEDVNMAARPLMPGDDEGTEFISQTCLKPSETGIPIVRPPFHLPTASLVAAIDTMRANSSKLVLTHGNELTQAGSALKFLECMERNGWPDTADNTYFFVIKTKR